MVGVDKGEFGRVAGSGCAQRGTLSLERMQQKSEELGIKIPPGAERVEEEGGR